MSNTVIIKGNKHGITVVLNGDDSFADLKNSVREKFRQSAAFFGKLIWHLRLKAGFVRRPADTAYGNYPGRNRNEYFMYCRP